MCCVVTEDVAGDRQSELLSLCLNKYFHSISFALPFPLLFGDEFRQSDWEFLATA